MRRRSSSAVLLGACLLAGACSAPVQPAPQDERPPSSPPATPSDDLTPRQETDIAYHASILRNDSVEDAVRAGAAERLLRMGTPTALEVLQQSLRTGDERLMSAVIVAMTATVDPEPALMESAVEATRTAPAAVRDQLAIALARYELDGLRLVAGLATDRTLPASDRLGAVHALGAFPSREAGDRLMQLADPEGGEDQTIRATAFDGLRRLAPMDFGNDYERWSEWWQQARRKGPQEWTRDLIRQHMERVAELEAAHGRLALRYVELLRDLYRTLTVDPEQLQRIIVDLEDPLPAVRAFAMQRIARLHRDSVIIPPEVRQVVISRLDDADPQLRRNAAELLHELAQPDLSEHFAQRLESENNRQVLEVLLQLIAHRPAPATLDALLRWVDDSQLGKAAADALWSLLRQGPLETEQLAKVQTVVRDAYANSATPSLARLFALTGADDDLPGILALLDHEEAEMRAAVAEALAARSLKEPLIAAADDAAVYPFALRAVSEGEPTQETMRQLIALAPEDDGRRDQWEQAVRTLAGRLDVRELAGVDALLEQIEAATPELRMALLRRAMALPPESLAVESRVAILERLAPLLIEHGEPLRAFELLSAFNHVDEHQSLAELMFQAALWTGNFDTAAVLRDDARSWLAVLWDVADRQQAVATALHTEIERRFGPTLEEADRRRLDAVGEQLPSSSAAADDDSRS